MNYYNRPACSSCWNGVAEDRGLCKQCASFFEAFTGTFGTYSHAFVSGHRDKS